jgi:hypothetical protein
VAAEPAAPPPGSTAWWCTCYARAIEGGSEPVTACRASKPECLALERTVADGTRGIVARSVTHPCREILTPHPGDAFAGRDAWKPSKKPGAWLSTGACHLPGPADPEAAEPPSAADEKILETATIGPLKWGMPAEKVAELVGEPGKKGSVQFEEATADYVQFWNYRDQGLTVMMTADSRKGKQRVGSITIVAPSTLKTDTGLGIGARRADVLKHHGKQRAVDSDPDDPEVFVAGSIYGGLFFMFKGDTVKQIYLGAGAE